MVSVKTAGNRSISTTKFVSVDSMRLYECLVKIELLSLRCWN